MLYFEYGVVCKLFHPHIINPVYNQAITAMAEYMTDEYKKLVGAKKYEQFIDTLIKITEWHKELDKLG